jgi:hypothetical protein
MGCYGNEVEEERAHVFYEFSDGACPSACGVDVDHGLIEVDCEEVYFNCARFQKVVAGVFLVIGHEPP